MLFILRCTFWLSIVYASILCPGVFRGQGEAAIRTSMTSAAALAGATDFCRIHAAACLGDAARLTALLEKTAEYRDLISASEETATSHDEASRPRATRHRGYDERLARAP